VPEETETSPLSGSSAPTMSLKSVVLPEPLAISPTFALIANQGYTSSGVPA
jgi:hypothetical protein